MHFSKIFATATTLVGIAQAQNNAPGYFTNFTTVTGNNLSFGRRYAVLNLDLVNGIVSGLNTTDAGRTWIARTSRWIRAVHAQDPAPISIFTRIAASNSRAPEVKPGSAFQNVISGLDGGDPSSPLTQLSPAFVPTPDYDPVLFKTRYYAGEMNSLELILRSQNIDTVILSGVRTSGVITSTAYRLFDLDYKVYVIIDNCIESPPNAPNIDRNLKQGVLPKLPVDVITLEQALAALRRSGPVLYGQS